MYKLSSSLTCAYFNITSSVASRLHEPRRNSGPENKKAFLWGCVKGRVTMSHGVLDKSCCLALQASSQCGSSEPEFSLVIFTHGCGHLLNIELINHSHFHPGIQLIYLPCMCLNNACTCGTVARCQRMHLLLHGSSSYVHVCVQQRSAF